MKGCEQFACIFCQAAIILKDTVNEIHQVTSSGRLYRLPFALGKNLLSFFTKTVFALQKTVFTFLKTAEFLFAKSIYFYNSG